MTTTNKKTIDAEEAIEQFRNLNPSTLAFDLLALPFEAFLRFGAVSKETQRVFCKKAINQLEGLAQNERRLKNISERIARKLANVNATVTKVEADTLERLQKVVGREWDAVDACWIVELNEEA